MNNYIGKRDEYFYNFQLKYITRPVDLILTCQALTLPCSYQLMCLKCGQVANSVDIDLMLHSVASDQGMHCLLRPVLEVLGVNTVITLSIGSDRPLQCRPRSDTAKCGV